MLEKEIKVEIDYTIGMSNRISGVFTIDANESYFKRDLERFTSFLNQAIKGSFVNDLMVTLTKYNDGIIEMNGSKRFIMRDFENGFEERTCSFDQFQEVPVKTFGTEGNGRIEMKRAITKRIKEFQKDLTEIES